MIDPKIKLFMGNGSFSELQLDKYPNKVNKIVTGRPYIIIRKDDKDEMQEFIKVFDRDIYYSRNFMEHILEIEHPNIIANNGVIENKDFLAIRYKYFNSKDLLKYLCDNHLYSELEDNKEEVIKQLFGAVSYLHDNNICHRDIKPDNVLYDSLENKVVLCDLEFVELTDKDGYNIKMENVKNNGTPEYLSPEMINYTSGKINLKKCDVWCLGILVCMIYSRKFPNNIPMYQMNSKSRIWRKIYNRNLFDVNKLPNPILRMVGTCLFPLPNYRPTLKQLEEWIY